MAELPKEISLLSSAVLFGEADYAMTQLSSKESDSIRNFNIDEAYDKEEVDETQYLYSIANRLIIRPMHRRACRMPSR